jgi:lysophospholipase
MLFLPGRGDAYEKYLETYEHWRRRGWRVTAMDWRGQAGSGRLGADEITGHVDDFAVWVGDLAAFWREWARDRAGPLVLVGHSMGGHLALRAVAERVLEPSPAALVLSAPMLDVTPERVPTTVKQGTAKAMCALGDPRRPAWKWSEKPGELPAFRQALLTHDEARYADELWWREARPELVMGPGSWGWVRSACASIRTLDRPGVLEATDLPVYMVATSADRLVSTRAIRRAVARLPRCEALWFGAEAAHEILREADPVRDRALAGIDAFLDGVVRP